MLPCSCKIKEFKDHGLIDQEQSRPGQRILGKVIKYLYFVYLKGRIVSPSFVPSFVAWEAYISTPEAEPTEANTICEYCDQPGHVEAECHKKIHEITLPDMCNGANDRTSPHTNVVAAPEIQN